MKFPLIVVFAATLFAQSDKDLPSGNRITPPTIARVSPLGIARGNTVELTVEGFNLAKTSAIYFSEKGIKGKILRVKELPDQADLRLGANGAVSSIDLGPLPPRNQVTVEIEIDPEASVGPVSFRLLTPLGTSPEGSFLIEPYFGETGDAEPNDSVDNATEALLPTVISGVIATNGDVDTYKIRAAAKQQLVFENGAALLGSSLQPVIRILSEDQTLIAEYGKDGGVTARYFAHRFNSAGTYYLQISDYQQMGRGGNFYRLKVGDFPLITGAYPLGLAQGKEASIQLQGFNVPAAAWPVKGAPSERDPFAVLLRPELPAGRSFNELRLELGQYPEAEAASLEGKLLPSLPLTLNGHLSHQSSFRFRAKRGEELVFEVNAKRLGSDLDSLLEVVDSKGQAIERAVLRPVWETITTLRDHDSASRGIRINTWNGLKVGDYVLLGSELIRVREMPRGPDDDMIFDSFGGQRINYLDTSAEAHAIDSAVYKVQVHPAGAQFSANGLPLTRLYYRNDDGGPGYGKDSLLHFQAPADGEYQLRLSDVRGKLLQPAAYRLTARRAEEDFRLSFFPRNPNVPPGSAVPLTVTAFRMDGFDGPIEVSLEGLPAGVSATPAVIAPGQTSTIVLLKSDSNLQTKEAVPFRVAGRSKQSLRYANEEDRLKLLSAMPQADLRMTAITKVVEIDPGGSAEVELSIERQNGFAGRVPVQVLNLPPSVRVLDVGLNGVLLNENETKRSFTLEALANSPGLEQVIYVAGRIETRSPQQNDYAAPQAILLRVRSLRVN